MKVKTNIKAGLTCRKAGGGNYHQTVTPAAKKGLRVRTNLKAGIIVVV